MILQRILDHLGSRRVAAADEIAAAIGSSPDAVRGMLDTLCRRGLVHVVRPAAGCGSSCRQCSVAAVEIYAAGPAPTAPDALVCRSQGH